MQQQAQIVVSDAEFPETLTWQGQEIELGGKRRVNVTAEFVTDSEDPEEVAIRISEWLRNATGREGVPYLIAVQEDDEKVFTEIDVPRPEPTGSATAAQAAGPRAIQRPQQSGQSMIIRRDPPPGRNVVPGQPRTGSPTNVIDTDDPQALIREMEKLAPIAPPVSARPAAVRGTVGGGSDDEGETAYRVTFTLLLDVPAAGAAQGEGGDS